MAGVSGRAAIEADLHQALVISTCERTDVLTIHPDHDAAFQHIIELMSGHGEIALADLRPQVYRRSGEERGAPRFFRSRVAR